MSVKVLGTSESGGIAFWLDAPRENFTQRCEREVDRMRHSQFAKLTVLSVLGFAEQRRVKQQQRAYGEDE